MKREIKFRAQRQSDGEWVVGDLHLLNAVPSIQTDANIDHTYHIDAKTIGMFTGLKYFSGPDDKKGKEVYEGDILRVREFENAAISTFGCYESETIDGFSIEECKGKLEKEFISEVKYEDSSFLISEDKECDTFMTVLHLDMKHTCPIFEFEVIGNIYDNPELLNK